MAQIDEVNNITVWSWQSANFRIDRDSVDIKRSFYLKECPELHQKYAAVRKNLKTDQILWCFTKCCDWKNNKTSVNHRVLWKLRLPFTAVLGFVDEWLGDRLIGSQPCPDLMTWRLWRQEAVRLHPGRPDKQNKFITQNLKTYEGRYLTLSDGLDNIFLDAPEMSEHVSALLPSPVKSEWVIERPEFA